ncbi:MAG: type II toxin-antitoxin system Phd/YefM family antitoxin [Spirochaetes bacterium]|nr:type II toxin-antitoxin system Phd/YefM family antitoxin [Spirochaetota bacterium]
MQTITVSQLKTHLSAEIKKLKKSGGVQIVQRDVPVARLLPIESPESISIVSAAVLPFEILPTTFEVDFDPLEDLLADRRKR